jgi:hypothetical protein
MVVMPLSPGGPSRDVGNCGPESWSRPWRRATLQAAPESAPQRIAILMASARFGKPEAGRIAAQGIHAGSERPGRSSSMVLESVHLRHCSEFSQPGHSCLDVLAKACHGSSQFVGAHHVRRDASRI